MFNIAKVDTSITLSQRMLIEKIEQTQVKYLDILTNIEFYPVLIKRCEEDKEGAEPMKIKELDGTIQSHQRNLVRAEQDLEYFVNKIKYLAELLNDDANKILTLETVI